jgi:capsular polysaccharide transport system permease protein
MSSHAVTHVSAAYKLKRQWQIIYALMMRDIRTRYFGNSWGFLIAVLWPLSHIFLLVIINTTVGRAAPFGESTALWYATGVLPFMVFNYSARFISMGPALNKELMVYPVVKLNDILISRAIIESLNATCIIILTMIILVFFGVNPIPTYPVEAFLALGANLLLGVGFGVINAIITCAMPGWLTGYALFSIVMWIASGVLFIPDALPEQFRYYLSFNPSLHGVQWMRSAFYEGYGTVVLDKTYMIQFSIVCLLFGLIIERVFRGKLVGN